MSGEPLAHNCRLWQFSEYNFVQTKTMELHAFSSPQAIRQAARQQLLQGPTAGLAPGFVQTNLAVLPKALAADFLQFCYANPKPCPLIYHSEQAVFQLAGQSVDIRSDIPLYKKFVNGRHVATLTDLRADWRDDLVSFLLGCSFSFEESLLAAGLEVRHITEQCNVPMYNTNLPLTPVGPFAGNMVVSMRPMLPADAIRAIQICSRFPAVHGAPVHFGDPSAIGIKDIFAPDYGDKVSIQPGEVPVFWACGVTPQVAISAAAPDLAFSHSPGCMLVTDLRNAALAVL